MYCRYLSPVEIFLNGALLVLAIFFLPPRKVTLRLDGVVSNSVVAKLLLYVGSQAKANNPVFHLCKGNVVSFCFCYFFPPYDLSSDLFGCLDTPKSQTTEL